jgi:hypothetical protein
MGLSAWVISLFAISVVFYMCGYHPLMFDSMEQNVGSSEISGAAILNGIFKIFSNPEVLAVLLVAAVASFTLGGSNFNIMFIFPIAMLMIIANVIILPGSYLFDSTLGIMGKIIGIFFNLWFMLVAFAFIRGGGE